MDVIHIIQKHPIFRIGIFCESWWHMVMSQFYILFYGLNYKIIFRVFWIIFYILFQNVQNQKPNLLFKFFIQNNIINQIFNLKKFGIIPDFIKIFFPKLFSGFHFWTFCADVIHIIQKHPIFTTDHNI